MAAHVRVAGKQSMTSFHLFRHQADLSCRCLTPIYRHYSGKADTSAEFLNGRTVKLETGCYARMCDGSAVATVGDTSVLVTAVSKNRVGGPVASFMPLTVDYRQKYAAAGHIPTNFLRRELAPTEKEILTSRIIDRSLRPLFPDGYLNDTQISCQLLAVDGLHEPDVVSINAASAALAVSDIPWQGPVGAVRVGLLKGEPVVFPTRKELTHSLLNMVVTAMDSNLIVMLEGCGANVEMTDLLRAIKIGVKECQQIVRAIKELAHKAGKPKRAFTSANPISDEIMEAVRTLSETKLRAIFTDFSYDKFGRDHAVSDVLADVLQRLQQDKMTGSTAVMVGDAFSAIRKKVFRDLILDNNIRCDGRGMKQLRQISCAVDLLAPLHGSSMFQRGQTQVQCTVAFDALENLRQLDPLLEATGGDKDRNFLLHYSFPSFATNELSRAGPITRREVGHGALAEKALRPLLPPNFPFAVLLTSTVLESNGSSSMATVCGGSLALMDAGVNVSMPAAGVAMGVVTRHNDNGQLDTYKILTDILGIEDYMGDMDFKVAGTKKGVTALQVDMKVPGLPMKVITEAMQQATEAKSSILEIMANTLPQPRAERKSNAPVREKVEVAAHKRSRLMGPGGVNVRRIQAETGAQLMWLEEGGVSLFAPNQAAMEEAQETIAALLDDREPTLEFGAIYPATITEVCPHGVLVSLYANMTPVLLHNSQLDTRKVVHASALGLNVGDEIKIKYFGRDPTSGHMRLSRRALQLLEAGHGSLPKKLTEDNCSSAKKKDEMEVN